MVLVPLTHTYSAIARGCCPGARGPVARPEPRGTYGGASALRRRPPRHRCRSRHPHRRHPRIRSFRRPGAAGCGAHSRRRRTPRSPTRPTKGPPTTVPAGCSPPKAGRTATGSPGGTAGLQPCGHLFDRQLRFPRWDAADGTEAVAVETPDRTVHHRFDHEGNEVPSSAEYPWPVRQTYRFEITEVRASGNRVVSLRVTGLATGDERFLGTLSRGGRTGGAAAEHTASPADLLVPRAQVIVDQ